MLSVSQARGCSMDKNTRIGAITAGVVVGVVILACNGITTERQECEIMRERLERLIADRTLTQGYISRPDADPDLVRDIYWYRDNCE